MACWLNSRLASKKETLDEKIILLLPLALLGAALISGCVSISGRNSSASNASGQRLWAQNCVRCHNSRSPSDYNNAQWSVAMLHMRVRANLTAEEHHKIQQFLQTGE
jgi:hypothetical protein